MLKNKTKIQNKAKQLKKKKKTSMASKHPIITKDL